MTAAADHRRHPEPARIERQLRQSLQLGGGDWTRLFTEPVAIIVYICIAALLLTPLNPACEEPAMAVMTARDR